MTDTTPKALRIPKAPRSLWTLITATAVAIQDHHYLNMTRERFVVDVLAAANAAHGASVNPIHVSEMYDRLMQDAGLPPLTEGDADAD